MIRIDLVPHNTPINGELMRLTRHDVDAFNPNLIKVRTEGSSPCVDPVRDMVRREILSRLKKFLPPYKAEAFATFAAVYYPWLTYDVVIYDDEVGGHNG